VALFESPNLASFLDKNRLSAFLPFFVLQNAKTRVRNCVAEFSAQLQNWRPKSLSLLIQM
jgi:hypothetical protein